MKTVNLKRSLVFLVWAVFSVIHSQQRTVPYKQAIELGKVSWYRNYFDAVRLAKKSNKAIFILFQEIPGCSTCRKYGSNVLSNPLLVDAIENEFIALAIYNNKRGHDKMILEKFNEPSWNNPVVRIVDSDGKDLTKRISGDYSAAGVYRGMVDVLKHQKKPIPQYLQLMGLELNASINHSTRESWYKMYCFWSGEKYLGSMKGVLNTQAGFMNGYEVVKVTWDDHNTTLDQLNQNALKYDLLPIPKHPSWRLSIKDENYYLNKSKYRFLPMSDLQKTRINSALGLNQDAAKYLSPRQYKMLLE